MPIPGHVPQLERLTPNLEDLKELFHQAVTVGARFKADESAYHRRATATQLRDLLVRDLPQTGTDLTGMIEEFEAEILPWCKNEASPRFLGFADTGDDPGALIGELLATFTQQNLINQGFDSPSATFIDVSVLRWLRHLLGYPNPPVSAISSVWDVGGIITPGGTTSNTVAMMLARERFRPDTMHAGIESGRDMVVLVPAGIGHYSIKNALSWIGLGDATVEVATTSFRYDLPSLATALTEHRERIGAVVAYAGDSVGAIVQNTSADVAYGTIVTFRPLDAKGTDITWPGHEAWKVVRIPVIMPGDRVPVGTNFSTLENEFHAALSVASVEITMTVTQWWPPDNSVITFSTVRTMDTKIRTEDTESDPIPTEVSFRTFSPYCDELAQRGAAVVYRNRTGRIIGGAISWPRSMLGGGFCPAGISDEWEVTYTLIGTNMDGLPISSIEAAGYCDFVRWDAAFVPSAPDVLKSASPQSPKPIN
jgi:hypothetical protein